MNRKSPAVPILITILLILALCCLGICLILFISGSRVISGWGNPTGMQPTTTTFTDIKRTPQPVRPSPTQIFPTTSAEIKTPASSHADLNLRQLQKEIVPENDPVELAQRLGGKNNISLTLPDENAPYDLGDRQSFWVTNVDNNKNFRVNTTMQYLGEHVYIWIENGVDYDQEHLIVLGNTFDQDIYPTNRDFFGSEWSPGVDHDPRIYIVYAGGLGRSLAGYYSSADQLHPDAHEFSNAHEMFLINADNVYLWESFIFGTLAHEFQHMIHWHTDKNEETWLNEGFSMLAELINGYDPGGFDYDYINNPDIQLTDWGANVGDNGPHYGAAMLFTTYLLDRFGEDATKAVVASDRNGMESIDLILAGLGVRDTQTGEIITANDFFADWAVANYLGDKDVADGRYFYHIYPNPPLAFSTTTFPICPFESTSNDVFQYGVDYVEIACKGDHRLNFSANTTINLMPTNPYSGDYFFWSNMGDHSNMSLTQEFDLTQITAPVQMTFQTWYDIEDDYDYVFVSASTDNRNWQILESTSCTWTNPSGNNYGCGLNGDSEGWQQEIVNLDQFAGEEVTIRFDYVTDAAVNGLGMVIDDIQIDAIDYFSDFESDDGGWSGEGFVRIQNVLPQDFRISVISFGDDITVTHLELDESNQASLDFAIESRDEKIILVISGTTPYTRQKAEYQIEIK
jgi:hypothetical protein